MKHAKEFCKLPDSCSCQSVCKICGKKNTFPQDTQFADFKSVMWSEEKQKMLCGWCFQNE